jgi:hypothetical protein
MAARKGEEHCMTLDRKTTVPPRWAESLLVFLLAPGDRDSVSGDLLEEYRESIVPAIGADADRWYVRQVVRYVLRQTWIWGALVAAILVTRYLLDALLPIRYTTHVIALRSSVMSWTLIGTFQFGGGWHAWRTAHLRSGLLLSVAIALIGGGLASAGTALCLAIWHDPATMRAIQGSGGLDEALWGVPLMLTPIGVIAGLQGAIVGRVAAAIYGWSRPKTKSA